MRKLAVLPLVLVALALGTAIHAQQDLGRIEGIVADQSGAVIPGAAVSLWSDAGNAQKLLETQSDGAGKFVFPALVPGKFVVRVEMDGFRSAATNVAVSAGRTATLTVVLEIGSVSETVTVAAPPPLLQTENSALASDKGRGGIGGGRGRGVGPGSGGGIGGGVFRSARAQAPQQTESYSLIQENRFHSVTKTPLSTFAADVDTASYSNVRRFLKEGNLPPKDAVRIEELINYFRYEGQDPEGEHPVRIDAETALCPWSEENRLVRISVRTKAIDMAELPPVNLTFLVDVSGSMQSPDKLPLLKRSLALLAEQLRPQDRVAITVYAGAAGVVLPPTSGSERAKILGVLERLEAGGSTAGAAGIQLAYATARESFKAKGINRVILATDGDFNVGPSTDSELVRMIEKERESGIFLSVLGFGTGNLQDAKMEQLADKGNGSYAYIDNLLEARRALVEQAGASLATVAKDVKLQVEFNPHRVDFYRLVGYENRLLAAEDFNDDKKDAGEMGAGHVVTALYEVVPKGGRGGADVDELRYQQSRPQLGGGKDGELLTVKVRYKQPDGNVSRLMVQTLRDQDRTMEQVSEEFRFAAAVAQFGLLLRDSEFKKDATYQNVVQLAESARGPDADGRRTEFIYLAKTAASLSNEQALSAQR